MTNARHHAKCLLIVFNFSFLLSLSVSADPQQPTHLNLGLVESWHAPNDNELLVKSKDNNYRATFSNGCSGLSKANTIAFITEKNQLLDASSAIRLPDGSRCNFSDFKLSCGPGC